MNWNSDFQLKLWHLFIFIHRCKQPGGRVILGHKNAIKHENRGPSRFSHNPLSTLVKMNCIPPPPDFQSLCFHWLIYHYSEHSSDKFTKYFKMFCMSLINSSLKTLNFMFDQFNWMNILYQILTNVLWEAGWWKNHYQFR